MMRSQSKALPLLGLLGIEVMAIIGLQMLGSSSTTQIPWGDLSTWLSTGTVDQLAAPIIRLAALILAYWMFVSTALCVIAQVSRIPAAIRATSMFTIPSVRRVVDGAMVMSIATTSVLGATGTAAFASDNSTVPVSNDITTSISAQSGDLSVPTPTVGLVSNSTVTEDDSAIDEDLSVDDQLNGDDNAVTSDDDDSDDEETTTSTTAADDTTTTTAASETTTTISPSPGDSWVSTPKPGDKMPASTTTSTSTAPTTVTSTTVAQGPSTPAAGDSTATPSTAAPSSSSSTPDADSASGGTQVLSATEHRVVAGENLWTISRDALASSSGRSASAVSEREIRDYWLKVIDANRSNLRSGDPHWIFPGETINLPAAS